MKRLQIHLLNMIRQMLYFYMYVYISACRLKVHTFNLLSDILLYQHQKAMMKCTDIFSMNKNKIKMFWRDEIYSRKMKLCRKAGHILCSKVSAQKL